MMLPGSRARRCLRSPRLLLDTGDNWTREQVWGLGRGAGRACASSDQASSPATSCVWAEPSCCLAHLSGGAALITSGHTRHVSWMSKPRSFGSNQGDMITMSENQHHQTCQSLQDTWIPPSRRANRGHVDLCSLAGLRARLMAARLC